VLLVAQSATARAIGSTEMRQNFSTRILVRYTLNAWRMLVPEVSPIPMPSDHHGPVQVVTRGRAQETQVLNLPNEEAREWAMSGVHSKGTTGPSLQKPPAPTFPAPDFADGWNTSAQALPPAPAPAPEPPTSNQDLVAEASGLTSSPAAATRPPRHRHSDVAGTTSPRRRRPGGGTARGVRQTPVKNRRQPRRATPGPARRPGIPRPGRQARLRVPLPRRRPQEVGPQPAPRRLRQRAGCEQLALSRKEVHADTLPVMGGLDDEIRAARARADSWARSDQQRAERERSEADEVQQLLVEAVERLRPYGAEVLVQVKPALFRGEYTANGQRFRRIAQQRCWRLARMSGRRRDEDDNLEDDWRESPVLLLEDGTAGRFWLDNDISPQREGEYVSSYVPDPLTKRTFLGTGNTALPALVKRYLGEAVVRYEHTG
jgi:hypothetical protein